ncbi:MAG: glycosyltransferase [Elusimicrobiota bacterium]|jgi:hypothetical protein|nr:glycosyltransferase [Elusimicrobiota bacterium]
MRILLIKLVNILSFFIFNGKKRTAFRLFMSRRLNYYRRNKKVPPIDYKNIPIYLICFNQVSYLRRLVEALEKRGYGNINFIDNASSYPPLLEYLSKTKYKVYKMDKNYGYEVFWDCGLFDDIITSAYYVVSDPDVLPSDDCPDNFLEVFYKVLIRVPGIVKAGAALRIDNIPEINREYVFKSEADFWTMPIKNNLAQEYFTSPPPRTTTEKIELFWADIDTTFAIYAPNDKNYLRNWKNKYKAVRIAGKYAFHHLPWETTETTEEQIYYQKTSDGKSPSFILNKNSR